MHSIPTAAHSRIATVLRVTYLAEMATPGNKGFYVGWQSASQQVAVIVAAALGYALNLWLTPSEVGA